MMYSFGQFLTEDIKDISDEVIQQVLGLLTPEELASLDNPSPETNKKIFRRLAKKLHPDVTGRAATEVENAALKIFGKGEADNAKTFDRLKQVKQTSQAATSAEAPRTTTAQGQAEAPRTTTAQGPTTVRQAIENPQSLVKKGAKAGGKLALDIGAGMAAEQLLQTTFPGLTDWAKRANINIGPVNVSAYDPIGALAFETGMQGMQALRGAKVTPGSLAAGAGGYLVGSKIGQGLARSLGAEEGGYAEMGAELAGGLVGQMGVDRLLGGGAQAAQAAQAAQGGAQAAQAAQAAQGGAQAAQAAQAAQGGAQAAQAAQVGKNVRNMGKGFSVGFRETVASRPIQNPQSFRLAKPNATPSTSSTPFKAPRVAGAGLSTLNLLGTGLSEYEKGTKYQGLGAELGNVASTTGLGIVTPAALAGLGTLATGGGAASAGVAAGAATVAALPLAVAAGGLALGAGIGRSALTDLEQAESAETTLRIQRDIYNQNKSKMTPFQRGQAQAVISKLEQTVQETQPSLMDRTYQETYGKLAGVKSQEELKKAVSAASEEGMKDVTFTRDASGKVTGINSDVADEMRKRSEEKARETAGMSAREKDEAQAARIAFMKSQAEKSTQSDAGRSAIKQAQAQERQRLQQSNRESIAQLLAAGYEVDRQSLINAGLAKPEEGEEIYDPFGETTSPPAKQDVKQKEEEENRIKDQEFAQTSRNLEAMSKKLKEMPSLEQQKEMAKEKLRKAMEKSKASSV